MALTLTMMEMKQGDRLDAEDREDLASMRAGITAVLDLHGGILDHFKLSSGKITTNATTFPLDGAIAHFVRVVQSLASYMGIAIVKDLASGATIRADKARMAVLMGGALSVASESGKGSTFTLTLPASIVSGTPESAGKGEDGDHSTAGVVPEARPTGPTAAAP